VPVLPGALFIRLSSDLDAFGDNRRVKQVMPLASNDCGQHTVVDLGFDGAYLELNFFGHSARVWRDVSAKSHPMESLSRERA